MTDSDRPDKSIAQLEGWKAIAGYLNRDVRTAKRWETTEGLPVYRHLHASRSSVYAFRDELDAWRANRQPLLKREPPLTPPLRAVLVVPAVLTMLVSSGGARVPGAGNVRAQPSIASEETFRKVMTGAGVISRDGQHSLHIDRNGNPVLRDIATGTERPVTTNASYSGSWATSPAISRDGRQAAFWWFNSEERRGAEIRVADLQGRTPPRTLSIVNEDIYPLDWSPDGERLAIAGAKGISILSLADGSRRRIHALNGRGPNGAFFSPDGRYLAFDGPANRLTDPFDVFIVSLDGSGTVNAIEHPGHDRVMEWSPDGRYLLMTSDRSGSVDLWAIPVAKGRSAGSARMLRRGVGVSRSFGLSRDGQLFMQTVLPDRDIEVVGLDLTSGRQTAAATRPIQHFIGMNEQPSWSRDGKQMAYVSRRDREAFPLIVIRANDTGAVKDLRPNMPELRGIDWKSDGQELIAAGHDLADNGVMFRIDVHSGAVTRLSTSNPRPGYGAFFPTWSADGRSIYYSKPVSATSFERAIVERDVASSKEQELIRSDDLGGHSLSPDGRTIAVVRSRRHIALVDVRTHAIRELFPVGPPAYLAWNRLAWTPDSRALIVKKNSTSTTGETLAELWIVPTDGNAPRRLEVDVRKMPGPAFSGIALHPQGRQLALVSDGETRHEVWALEHFLGALP